MLRGRIQDTADRPHNLLPAGGLRCQLLAALSRQAVILRLAVVFGGSPERGDPPAVIQAMQRRIEGAVLNLQHLFGTPLDRVSDRLSMSGTQDQGPEDQHVQGSLDHFELQGRFASWHVLVSVID
ncbi:hypothetical protein SBA3_290043 [Candidatus Sulfopaludibacter sp. SbA3]|nr:hypothetical protein SBA3_290043 [Candidatus Sulfopaludibacter sp. SbA3]